MDEKIDFIIPWVDDSDEIWQKERNKYAWTTPDDLAKCRFRDRENLKYLFRWIEKFAPWVNSVFFVTCGHYPSWLNLKHPKLKFIKHDEYIPKKYLPTFNSHTIELNFHRIRELSEHFVYFNDDMFIIDYMKKDEFFKSGLPRQIAWLDAIVTNNDVFGHILLNDIQLINRHFNHKDVLRNNIHKWFYPNYWIRVLLKTIFLQNYPRFVWLFNQHLPNSLLKSTMNQLWNEEFTALDNSSKSRFRTDRDVNQYIFSWYDIARGNFKPRKRYIGRYFFVKNNDNKELIKTIMEQRCKMICINDSDRDFDFEKVKSEIIEAFEKILPEKSEYEK